MELSTRPDTELRALSSLLRSSKSQTKTKKYLFQLTLGRQNSNARNLYSTQTPVPQHRESALRLPRRIKQNLPRLRIRRPHRARLTREKRRWTPFTRSQETNVAASQSHPLHAQPRRKTTFLTLVLTQRHQALKSAHFLKAYSENMWFWLGKGHRSLSLCYLHRLRFNPLVSCSWVARRWCCLWQACRYLGNRMSVCWNANWHSTLPWLFWYRHTSSNSQTNWLFSYWKATQCLLQQPSLPRR